MQKAIKVGVMPFDDYQKRVLAIARGDHQRVIDEPKIWFESLQSMAQLLSPENQRLLTLIIEKEPKSLTELARISDRKKSNLSRTLKTLQQCGIIRLSTRKGRLVPEVAATRFQVEFGIELQAPGNKAA